MRVVLTSKQHIVAKNGDEYEKLHCLNKKGEVIAVLIPSDLWKTSKAGTDESIVDQRLLSELFDQANPISIEFNERGRVVEIE